MGFGFKAVVVLAGHGAYVQPLERLQVDLGSRMPDTLLLFGIETTIVGPIEGLGVDHAAFWETSDALELFPQLVDLSALTPGRDPTAEWPRDVVAPASASQYPDLVMDPRQSHFGQLGDDPTSASAESVRMGINKLVDALAARVASHLGTAA